MTGDDHPAEPGQALIGPVIDWITTARRPLPGVTRT
jgi:hypothetical protein